MTPQEIAIVTGAFAIAQALIAVISKMVDKKFESVGKNRLEGARTQNDVRTSNHYIRRKQKDTKLL